MDVLPLCLFVYCQLLCCLFQSVLGVTLAMILLQFAESNDNTSYFFDTCKVLLHCSSPYSPWVFLLVFHPPSSPPSSILYPRSFLSCAQIDLNFIVCMFVCMYVVMKHVVSSLPLWCSHFSSSLSDANELLTGMPHPTLMPQPPKSGPEELHRYTVGRTQPMSVGPRQTRGTRGVRTRVACRSVIWWLVRPLSRRPTKCGRRSCSTSKLVGCTSKRVRERGRVSLD